MIVRDVLRDELNTESRVGHEENTPIEQNRCMEEELSTLQPHPCIQ